MWDVVVHSAQVPTQTPSGASWDSFGGAPDPFFRLTLSDGSSHDSSTIDNTFLPDWEEIVVSGLTAAQLEEGAEYALYDEDAFSIELIGTCNFIVGADQFGVPLVATCTDKEDTELYVLQLSVLQSL